MKEYDYSKDLKTCPYIFVYGTLKKGYGNSRLLTQRNAEYCGPRVTKDKYVLGNVGFPYMFPSHLLTDQLEEEYHKPVVGDLWVIPGESGFKALDGLEGYPSHYDREVIELADGMKAWTYLQKDPSRIEWCYICGVTDNNEWEWS